MLQRQKILVELLLKAGKPVQKLRLVKLSFLINNETDIPNILPFYDFVPYHYGPFSFTLYHELGSLINSGIVSEKDDFIEIALPDLAKDTVISLKNILRRDIGKIMQDYNSLSISELLDLVYAKYPWFATRSKRNNRTTDCNLGDRNPALYTAGYEGRSLDAYFDLLLQNGIKQVLDVRKNAYSRKYGFIASVLKSTCERMGMQYSHQPDLGIPSNLRKTLSDQKSYDELFDRYEKEILANKDKTIEGVAGMICDTPSVLLCFEAESKMCHRSRLASRLSRKTDLPIVNL
jgi:uncharacterized protein (DUF488 family)